MQQSSAPRNRPRLHPQIAVALRYEPEQGIAPQVVASGKGYLAQRMQEIAQEAGVPIHKDAHLAELLERVPVPETIPEELFEAVARVIAFVWRVDHHVSGQIG